MSSEWAVTLHKEHVRQLARLRKVPGLTVCERDEEVWLKGTTEDEEIAPQIATIPGARRFEVLVDKQVRPTGRLVPEGYLPEGPWQPLDRWLQIEMPSQPGCLQHKTAWEPLPLQLVRTGKVREPALLEVNLEVLAEYMESAPLWRIQRWQLALSRDGTGNKSAALIRGQPLPPLPGRIWVEEEGICVPAGYAWQPAVNAAVIRQLLQLAAQNWVLLNPQGTHEVILPEHWVHASRSAVRQMRMEVLR